MTNYTIDPPNFQIYPKQIITYGEIVDGDLVYVEGYLFEASNVHVDVVAGGPAVRFTGRVVDERADIKGTGYDGGEYGGRPDIRVAIVERASRAKPSEVKHKPQVGDSIQVHGRVAKILKVHPFGTLDVQFSDGQTCRISGLSF